MLSLEDQVYMKEFVCKFYSLSLMNFCLQWKGTRALWLEEGDANTKFFHGLVDSHKNVVITFDFSPLFMYLLSDCMS